MWRELRRLSGQRVENPVIDPVLAAADVGDWAAYTQLQGGATVERRQIAVRVSYEEEQNQFEESVKKIRGVFAPIIGAASFICTRLIKWVIVSKNRGASPPWSSVNNCTEVKKSPQDDRREKVINELKKYQINYNPHQLNHLLAGRELKFSDKLLITWVKDKLAVIDLRQKWSGIPPDIEWSF